MMWTTHVVGGAAAWLVVTRQLPVPEPAAVLGAPVAMWLSMWPDLDHDHSKASRAFGWFRRPVARFVRRRFGGHHRGGAHSLIAGVPVWAAAFGALCVLAWVVLSVAARRLLPFTFVVVAWGVFAAYVGAASHPLLDYWSCNCKDCDPETAARSVYPWDGKHLAGCELLWPLVKRRFGVPWVAVGDKLEEAWLVLFPLLVVAVWAGAGTVGRFT